MKTGKSARMFSILGATLTFFGASGLAQAEAPDSSAQSIHTGGVQQIHTGGVHQIHTGGVRQIHTGGVHQIHTGGVQQIHTGGVHQIHTGGIHQIHTGGVRQIHTGGVHQIHTGGVQQIHTGGVHQIHTGGVQQIHTGGVHQIHTGGVQQIHTGGVHQIHTGGVQQIHTGGARVAESELVLMAPIEALAADDGTFHSMGQTVFVAAGFFSSFSVGDYVAVRGTVAGPGFIYADYVDRIREEYISGSSLILVAGYPSAVDHSRAFAKVGALNIDYSNAMFSTQHPALGGIVKFSGIEAQPGSGLLTSDSLVQGAAK